MCILIFYKILSAIFLSLRKIQGDILKNVRRFSCEVSLTLLIFKKTEFSGQSLEKSNFIKIRPVGADLFHVDRTDRGTDMTKISVSFRNYSKVPTQSIVSQTPLLFQPFNNNGRT